MIPLRCPGAPSQRRLHVVSFLQKVSVARTAIMAMHRTGLWCNSSPTSRRVSFSKNVGHDFGVVFGLWNQVVRGC